MQQQHTCNNETNAEITHVHMQHTVATCKPAVPVGSLTVCMHMGVAKHTYKRLPTYQEKSLIKATFNCGQIFPEFSQLLSTLRH